MAKRDPASSGNPVLLKDAEDYALAHHTNMKFLASFCEAEVNGKRLAYTDCRQRQQQRRLASHLKVVH